MPTAYWIVQGPENPKVYRYLIGGSPAYKVPRTRCAACGSSGQLGPYYPSMDISDLPADTTRYLSFHQDVARDPLTLDEYHELEAKLTPRLGPERPLSPLANLGPLRGQAFGKFGDFAWTFERSLFVRRSVFAKLREGGFALTGAPAALQYRRERHDPLVELEALPTARLHPSQQTKTCKTCGLEKGHPSCLEKSAAKQVRLDADSFDESLPLQRVLDRCEIVLVNEALAQFIRDNELSDVELIPMKFE